MTIITGKVLRTKRCDSNTLSLVVAVALSVGLMFGPTAIAAAKNKGNGDVCAHTAQTAFSACKHDAMDNYKIEVAKCLNETGASSKAQCLEDAEDAKHDDKDECREVRGARLDVCGALTMGGGAYDPAVSEIDWLPAEAITGNTYFPLVPGTVNTYENTDGEAIVVTVTSDTTEIMGVPVRVVTDVVTKDGQIVEDTIDWYGQDSLGNVWYFGERTEAAIEGTKLIQTDGSWEAGIDHAKPGLIMPAVPVVGDVYRQEWLLGDAEDVAEVLGVGVSEQPAGLPAPAVVCSDNCVLTHDFTPLEPDASELKYYAPGVGMVLELDDNDPDFREWLVSTILVP